MSTTEQYKKPTDLAPHTMCTYTTVEARKDLVAKGQEHAHAGTIAHRCVDFKGHEGLCICGCGHQWKGWG